MNELVLETKPCPLGCFPDDVIITHGCDRLHHLPGEFTVVRCRTCGLMRTNPRPTIDSIGSYYPDDYSPYHSTQVSAPIAPPTRPSWWRLLRTVFAPRDVSQAIPAVPPGRLLEIGCASGKFLDLMQRQGWETTGIEPSPTAAAAARDHGFQVYTGTLESAPDPAAPYHLVVGWMVLEHLHEPVEALQKLHRWTKPGAWLAFSIPDAGGWEFRVFRSLWYALDLPRHNYHFSPETLKKVLLAGGWSCEQIHWHASISNLMRSLRYVAEDRGWPRVAQVFEALATRRRFRYPLAFLARLLQVTRASGRMTVWARRIDA